jgi:hypothetical protein
LPDHLADECEVFTIGGMEQGIIEKVICFCSLIFKLLFFFFSCG